MKAVRPIVLARLAKHEFVRALRAIEKEVPPIVALQNLIGQQEKSIERLTKLAGFTFLGLFWLRTHFVSSDIKFTVFSQDFIAPASYLIFVLGFSYLGLMLELLNYCFLLMFVGVLAKRSFGLNTSDGLNSLFNSRSIWSVAGNFQYRFLKSGSAHIFTSITTLVFLALPLLSGLIFVGLDILRLIALTWASSTGGIFESVILAIAIALLIFPWIWIVLLFVPFKFSKNYMFIRWDFLLKLHRSMGVPAPGIPRWLADKRS